MTQVIELPIERFEAFEEQFGIKLEALSAPFVPQESCFSVGGDVFAANGTTIGQDIDLVISGHDAAGKVLISEKCSIKAKSFSGIDTFSVCFDKLSDSVTVTKVRVYPKPAT
ncbi:MAG: hypothetical protein RLZZ574_562 [Cyanobacteriota bacterium]